VFVEMSIIQVHMSISQTLECTQRPGNVLTLACLGFDRYLGLFKLKWNARQEKDSLSCANAC
jgi:hypothetical protein